MLVRRVLVGTLVEIEAVRLLAKTCRGPRSDCVLNDRMHRIIVPVRDTQSTADQGIAMLHVTMTASVIPHFLAKAFDTGTTEVSTRHDVYVWVTHLRSFSPSPRPDYS